MENVQKKTKVAFFFGAGAEGDGNFNLPLGGEFLNEGLLTKDFKNEYGKHLKKFFNDSLIKKERGSYFNGSYKYTMHQINSGNKVYELIGKKIIYKLYGNEKREELEKKLKLLIKPENFEEFKKIFNKEITSYEKIKSKYIKDLLAEYKEKSDLKNLFDIGIAGLMDRYFPSIAAPDRFPSIDFSIAFNYYWTIYLLIVKSILESFKEKNILGNRLSEFFTNDKVDFYKIIKDADYFTGLLYSYADKLEKAYPDSYYSKIKAELDKDVCEVDCTGVITTNYYCFPEIVSKNVAYVNGKLNLFEFPELLEVRDLSKIGEIYDDKKKKLFFPFIFGQSYTKPIISSYQTEEFHKMHEILKTSQVLVILGFNINVDDNHINSFIREFLLNPEKQLIFVAHENDISVEKLCCKLGNENKSFVERVHILFLENLKNISEKVESIFNKIKTITKGEQ